MSARRPSSAVCLFCRARQNVIATRRFNTVARLRLEAVAVRPEDDGFLLDQSKDVETRGDQTAPVLPIDETVRQWRLHSPVDELREALLDFDALWKRRDLRVEVLRSLSNPWPPFQASVHNDNNIPKAQLRLPEANAAPMPHAVFRRKVREACNGKDVRRILRAQLLRCEWPKEILRIVAVSMQHKTTARNLAVLAEAIVRALYRCRNNASDPEILRVVNILVQRFKWAGIEFNPVLLQIGAKFAARARSLDAMKKYLRLIRESGMGMTSNVFRSIIAKFSIGHRGLGEIRNGRWRRDALLQVLNGFESAKDLPVEQQYHLGTFVDRDDWQYLHGWVAVLARCKQSEAIWHEWQLWKQSPARRKPKSLKCEFNGMTTKKRGDYWFTEQMTHSGDLAKAWQILNETGLQLHTLKDRVKTRLLEGIEHASVWDEEIRNQMLWKYDLELRKIEQALGLHWVPETADLDEDRFDVSRSAAGRHELAGDQYEALEKLGADDWKPEELYGFPYDSDEAMREERDERALHEAEERGLADGANAEA